MNRFISTIKLVSFSGFLVFLLQINLFAQQSQHSNPSSSGNNYKYDRYRTGHSTLSEAADINYDWRNYKRNNDTRRDRYNRKNENHQRRDNRGFDDKYADRNDSRYNKRDKKSENYFHIDRSGRTLWDGKHWDVDEFPLKVYVKESSSEYYKPVYKDYVYYAFDVWKKADNRINYTFVNNSRVADVSVIFVENLGKKYKENYLGLTEYDIGRRNEIEYSKIQISLLKFGDEVVSDGEIKATVIHELGHAFGLGHSESERDIMYPFIDSNHTAKMNYNELSFGDKEAVRDAISLGEDEQFVSK